MSQVAHHGRVMPKLELATLLLIVLKVLWAAIVLVVTLHELATILQERHGLLKVKVVASMICKGVRGKFQEFSEQTKLDRGERVASHVFPLAFEPAATYQEHHGL